MILNSTSFAKKISIYISVIIFLIISCNDASKAENTAKQDQKKAVSAFRTKYSAKVDSLQIYYRQYKLVKLAQLIYNLEPKLKENSYDMGVLVYYKGLLFEEINDSKNYQEEDARLLKIAQSVQHPAQKIMLDYCLLENKFFATSNLDQPQLRKLLMKSLDTLEHVDKAYRDANYYFKKGSSTYLLAEYFIDHKDYDKAQYYNDLTKEYLDSTNVEYYKVYPYYIQGLILANKKKPHEALTYYHKIIHISEKYHSTRFLRNIYPVLNTSYNELGDFQSAAKYMLKYKMTNDTILSTQREATNFVNAKEKEAEGKTKRKMFIISVLSVLAVLVLLYFSIKKLRRSKPEVQVETVSFPPVVDVLSPDDLYELVELSKNNENAFYLKFSDYNPLLIKDLTAFLPKLSDSEVKFCMYLSMKYTVKEIALYTNTSIKSVESKKYRLKKKINTPENEELAKRLNL